MTTQEVYHIQKTASDAMYIAAGRDRLKTRFIADLMKIIESEGTKRAKKQMNIALEKYNENEGRLYGKKN
jgi:hypothetical protein